MVMGRFDLITVARQVGAGGSELAQSLGSHLGWPVLEHEVVRAAATVLGVTQDALEPMDEYALSALERFGSSFYAGLPELAPSSGAAYHVDPDRLARAEHAVLRAAAGSPPVILVGHGAQCLFRARPSALHVRVVAPLDARARRVASRASMPFEAARSEVKRRDRDRDRYLRHHFACDTHDAMLYAVQINTSVVSTEDAVAMLAALVTSPRAPSPRLPPGAFATRPLDRGAER